LNILAEPTLTATRTDELSSGRELTDWSRFQHK